MGFDIIAGADRRMYPGQIIEYRVSPLLGIKTKWVTVPPFEMTVCANQAQIISFRIHQPLLTASSVPRRTL